MRIPFTKMHGLGNDFVIIDAINHDLQLSKELVGRIADRHFGVGCDQILVLVAPPVVSLSSLPIDFFYRIFNRDGSEAGQCVNGVRCLAAFVKNSGLSNQERLTFATKDTSIKTILERDGKITTMIQPPMLDPQKIPLLVESRSWYYDLKLTNGDHMQIGAVSVGNPHAVILVDEVISAPVKLWGDLISNSGYFPEGANVNFMQILDAKQIKLRVYERGSGETLACGSGAGAAVVMGKLWGFLESTVMVELPGGDLTVSWYDLDESILVTGEAKQVFVGEMNLTG